MKPVLRILVGTGRARADLRREDTVSWSGEIAFAGADELRDTLTALLVGGVLPERPGALEVELERSLAQVRTLSALPPVSAAQLKSLVATQSGRFFRRNGKPLVTDAVWGTGARESRVVLAAAVEEPWVDAVAEAARAGGVPLQSVCPADLPTGVRIRLRSTAERTHLRQNQRLAVRRFAVLVAGIWVAAAATLAVRLHAARVTTDREIASLEAPVAAITQADQALDSASRMVEGLARARRDRSRVLISLTSISAVLPESAFVASVSLDARGRGEITIVARRSSEVLASLDGAPGVVSPQLQGGVARETVRGHQWERFTLSLGGGVAR